MTNETSPPRVLESFSIVFVPFNRIQKRKDTHGNPFRKLQLTSVSLPEPPCTIENNKVKIKSASPVFYPKSLTDQIHALLCML